MRTGTTEMQGNHCGKTCRQTRPYEPESWCSGCHVDEAADREANMRRWLEAAARRREFEEWAVANGPSEVGP